MGSHKVSLIWEYFEEDSNDYSWAICQIPGCRNKRVSRGKSGKPRSAMTTGVLDKHLASHHPKAYKDFLRKKEEKEAQSKKRKEDEEDESEMESGSILKTNLRSKEDRRKFLKQSSLQNWWGEGKLVQSPSSTYDINDIRAKDRHRGVLMMVINDLQPFSMVNDPGFLHYSHTMDRH